MSVAPWCHKCIICDILQFRGYSIAYADCSMQWYVWKVHLSYGLCLKYGLLAVFWDLNFYTGPKTERLERGWYPLSWIQTGSRQTMIVYKSSHECQESVVLAISFNGHFFNCDNISTIFFFYVHILCIAFSLVWLKGIQVFFFWLCPWSFSQPHLRSQCRISSQNALACIWGPSAADFQLFD